MTIGELLVALRGDASKLTGDITKAAEQGGTAGGKSFTARFRETISGPNGIGAGLKAGLGLGVGLTAVGAVTQAFGLLKDAVGDSVAAFEESERVAAQTAAVLKSTGAIAGVTADSVASLASSIRDVSTFDDEAIQKGENLLLTFTNIRNEAGRGNQVFDQAVKVMVDMATAMGTDATGAATQLGKALNDPVRGMASLTKVGVTFTDQQRAQIKTMVASGDVMGAQKVILADLTKKFGGSAAAAADTFAGKMSILDSHLGDVKESIGKVAAELGGALLQGIDVVTGAWRGLNDAMDPSGAEFRQELDLIRKLALEQGLSADGAAAYAIHQKELADATAELNLETKLQYDALVQNGFTVEEATKLSETYRQHLIDDAAATAKGTEATTASQHVTDLANESLKGYASTLDTVIKPTKAVGDATGDLTTDMAKMPPLFRDVLGTMLSEAKTAMADIRWQLHHPGAMDKTIAGLRRDMQTLVRERNQAHKRGDDRLVAQIDATIVVIKGQIAELGQATTGTIVVSSSYSDYYSDAYAQDAYKNRGGAWRDWKRPKNHAAGGTALGWSWVGEQGPELAYFDRPTEIVPAGRSRAMATMPSIFDSLARAPSPGLSAAFAHEGRIDGTVSLEHRMTVTVLDPDGGLARAHVPTADLAREMAGAFLAGMGRTMQVSR